VRKIIIINDDSSNQQLFEAVCNEHGWSKRSTFITDMVSAMNYFWEESRFIQADIERSLIILNLHAGSPKATDFIYKLKKSTKLKCIPLVVLGDSNNVSEVDEIIVMGANSYFKVPHERASRQNLIKMILNFWSNEWVR
jgi:DNA-binding response OmpR family regulator